jgi:LPXTG-site transpeptidase (sortase) family protein
VEFRADVDGVVAAPAPPPPAPPSPAPPSPAPVSGRERVAEIVRATAEAAQPDAPPPARISIPAIQVDSDTIGLNLTSTQAEVPESFQVAGWYRQTKTPGTIGPAVIVGHVGSVAGPGIFSDLDDLRPGDEVVVTDVDGQRRTFVVDRGALVDKYDRPDDVMGWGENRAELRLITCGGDFDPNTGHFVSNYVIWAHEAPAA